MIQSRRKCGVRTQDLIQDLNNMDGACLEIAVRQRIIVFRGMTKN